MAEIRRQNKGFLRRPRILDYVGAGGVEEPEAQETAKELVRSARSNSTRYTEGVAPDPDAVSERREALQDQENSS